MHKNYKIRGENLNIRVVGDTSPRSKLVLVFRMLSNSFKPKKKSTHTHIITLQGRWMDDVTNDPKIKEIVKVKSSQNAQKALRLA